MSEWKTIKIGDVCTVTKGSTGIMKAIPGDYPMVALAEARTTHNEYQFNCAATIIPLVSSTGHGHASMKRVHYQEGKFALGSILCAVIPKDTRELNPKFLHLYLSYFKDTLLVPLMHGAANVSLSISKIKDVTIILPPINYQLKIIEAERSFKKKEEKLLARFIFQLEMTKKLRQSVTQDAILGKFTKGCEDFNCKLNNYNDLYGSQNLPDGWAWERMGSVCEVQTGKKDVNEGSENGSYNFYTCAKEPLKSDTYSFQGESILLPGNGANVGFASFVNEKFEAYQRTYVLNNFVDVDPAYLFVVLSGAWSKNLGQQFGSAINYIKIGNITNFPVPIPPMVEQRMIVGKINKIIVMCDQIENNILKSQQHTKELIQSYLQEAFKSEL